MNAIFLLEAYFRRKVEVEKNDGPTRLLTLLEWRKTVRRKAKCNVAFIRKVEIRIVHTSRDNSVEYRLVMGAIKNVFDNTRLMFVIGSIAHLPCMNRVCRHSL